jgi:ribonuclease HII
MKLSPLEKSLINKGYSVSGIDEVGRGPLAGPLFVGIYQINKDTKIIKDVNDSKKLSEKKRNYIYNLLTENKDQYSTESIDEEEIDRLGIVIAIKNAMEKASLKFKSDMTLIDGLFKDKFNINNYRTEIKGDSIHYSIAAASIIAKIQRDKLMIELSKKYPQYDFENNKGYGTKIHIEALKKYGPCKIHRNTFIKGILNKDI